MPGTEARFAGESFSADPRSTLVTPSTFAARNENRGVAHSMSKGARVPSTRSSPVIERMTNAPFMAS